MITKSLVFFFPPPVCTDGESGDAIFGSQFPVLVRIELGDHNASFSGQRLGGLLIVGHLDG